MVVVVYREKDHHEAIALALLETQNKEEEVRREENSLDLVIYSQEGREVA